MANATVNLPLVKSGYVQEEYPTTVFPTSSSGEYETSGERWHEKKLYLGFQALPSALQYNRLYAVRLLIQGKSVFHRPSCSFDSNESDFDPVTLTYGNRPLSGLGRIYNDNFPQEYADIWFGTATPGGGSKSSTAQGAIRYGLQSYNIYEPAYFRTVLAGGGTPYLEVTYDDSVLVASQIKVNSAPRSGYVNPRNATAFSWSYERTGDYYCAGDFVQASAALKWRVQGASAWNTVSASGANKSLTVAANTFPTASTIEWYLTGTDTAGTTSTTPTYTISTAAGAASAIPVSPIGAVEDGSQPIILEWTLGSTDGQAPSYVDLRWKTQSQSESQWTALLSHATARTYHSIPADTLPAGGIQWAVRSYNVDNVAGEWSKVNGDWPSFICVDAPDAPQGVTATSVPLTTVSWQATGQEAYEIQVDGMTMQKAFGPTVSSWTVPTPLQDGTHVIRVRVQGIYGLWSAWSEATITVANTPAQTLTLAGEFEVDANLTLAFGGSTPASPDIHWYRDGAEIAWTTGPLAWTDRFVLGQHTYYAEVWHSNGNYSRSNSLTGTMRSCYSRIAEFSGGSWLEVEFTEISNAMQSFSWTKKNSLRHVRGAVWPVLEMAPFEDETGSYECAVQTVDEMRALEALKGKVVILKSRGGQVVVGAMTSLTKQMKNFHITFTFALNRIQIEDYVRYVQGD